MTLGAGFVWLTVVLCVGFTSIEAENTTGIDQPLPTAKLPTNGSQLNNESLPSKRDDDVKTSNDDPQQTSMNGTVTTSHGAPFQDQNVRIVVVGRSGFGVSSTIRELIGKVTKCEMPDGNETMQDIYEYTISDIPGTNSSIKILDLPGFVDGRTLEKEAQILATLKSYISNASDGQPPDFFLALSGFDDNRYVGVHSLFVQFLKRLELFEHEFLRKVSGRNMNIVFLLTKMMSETRANQRRPTNKINNFRNVIRDYTRFPPPYQIVVGDNHAQSEHNAPVEDGYYRLPNKEHYPKNIWEAMINSSTSDEDVTRESQVHAVLNAIKDNRETEMKCKVELIRAEWSEYNADADAFLYLLHHLKNLTIEENEVNQKIQQVFDSFPMKPDRMDGIIQKTALQLYLQNENITSIKVNIPTSYVDRAAFFQKSPLISSAYPSLLLNEAFKLEMAEYINPLTVGYGYDVLTDEVLLETPFQTVKNLPSSIGYQVPNFMKCKKFLIPDALTYQTYSHNISDYFTTRLKQLKFTTKENITAKFSGKAKDGYNLPLEKGVNIATLTATKEIRTLKCVLAEKGYWGELNEEFVETVNALDSIDLHDRDSITDWNVFFGKYGTHIVVQGYGGGKLVGSIVGTNVRKVFESDHQSDIDDTLESILKFSAFSVPGLEKPSYQLYAGEVGEASSDIRQLHDLPEAQRDKLLHGWELSLHANFEMLRNEFVLERISTVVKEKLSPRKGKIVDEAIELLLRGELKKRQRNRGNVTSRGGGNRTTTRKPLETPVLSTNQSSVHASLEESNLVDTINNNSTDTAPLIKTGSQQSSKPSQSDLEDENEIHNSTQHQNIYNYYKGQKESDKKIAQILLDNIKNMAEEQETKHKKIMKEFCMRKKLENLRTERCGGFKSTYNPGCWSDAAYAHAYSENIDYTKLLQQKVC